MKVLITGSSGYVARVLCRHLTEQGIPVAGVDLDYDGYMYGNPLFSFYRGSVTDRSFMADVFRGENPSHVIHLAYLMNPLHDRRLEYAVDVTGSMVTLVCAHNTPSVKQFILMSSASAYGAWPDNPLWITEETPLLPGDYRYGKYKKRVEECYERFQSRDDLHVVTLRMCTAVGPSYHKKGGVVSLLARSPLLPRFGGRFCELQFIHEHDLCALLDLVIHDADVRGTFNLAPDSYSPVNELAPGRIYLPLPLPVARFVTGILWNIRLSSSMPAAMNLATYGIVISPRKIMQRYGYTFRYSTLAAYLDTVEKRKKLGTL